MKNDGNLGCTVGLLLFGGGVALVVMWQSGSTWQLIITVAAALILLAGTKHLGRRGAYKFKIAGLLSLCLSLILLFAVLYSVVFRNVPGSFRLSSEMFAANVRDAYPDHSRRFLKATREHYYLMLLRGRPADVLKVLRSPVVRGVVDAKAEIGLNEVLEYRCREDRMLVGSMTADALVPVTVCDLIVTNRENPDSSFTLKDISLPAGNLMEVLEGAKTESEVVGILDAPIKAKERERDASEAEMSKLVMDQQYLEMSHFIYFSAAVMTTVGSNDISPNSQVTRYLVVLQSLVAVFFFGYSLHLLWPEKAQATSSGPGEEEDGDGHPD